MPGLFGWQWHCCTPVLPVVNWNLFSFTAQPVRWHVMLIIENCDRVS